MAHCTLCFSECTVAVDCVKLLNTNSNCAHKALIETEFSSRGTAENTWLVCQGYYYGDEPAKFDGAENRANDVAARKASVADSLECFLLGKPASSTLTFDLLLRGVTLLISFRRSPNSFTVISDSNKHYRVKIVEANLYVRRMTVIDHQLSAIEKTLLKTTVVYQNTELLPRFFLVTAGIQSWSQEDILSKEPVLKLIIAMSTNQLYLETNSTNPFHY